MQMPRQNDWPVEELCAGRDEALVRAFGERDCVRDQVLPVRRVCGETLVLAANDVVLPKLEAQLGRVRLAIVDPDALRREIEQATSRALVKGAEMAVADEESCRSWNAPLFAVFCAVMCAALVFVAVLSPRTLGLTLAGFAVLVSVLNSSLKAIATIAGTRSTVDIRPPVPLRLPVVTVFVPLFKESKIASHLIRRLSAIDYPDDKLDVCLLLEADDKVTRDAVAQTELPSWMRAIVVPEGSIKTKPRALNYGLNHAKGSIIGVYDAEDSPSPDQIHKVVARFAMSGPEVVCLQGVLDFYNARTNWLSRCFALEYATWFQVILPGLARLGLVIPLGGTTLFFRRRILEEIGAWDAHNVTEDADLGIRLARRGYRTELFHSITGEEANCRWWPWIKQRSRWLKGYAVTYVVHMRSPRRLWRDLGAKRFCALQIQFLGTLLQFVLAPVLWSLWLAPLGLWHWPVTDLPIWAIAAVISAFSFGEFVTLTAGFIAAHTSKRMWLAKWVPTLHFYFPLATFAVYKGLWELLHNPFYWDKTEHGIYDGG